ncbi:MAG: hypothetical protein KIT18_03105 [Burkholderiales bacterium]|nr:hypothetical protein [Burkholderiales bacterium]
MLATRCSLVAVTFNTTVADSHWREEIEVTRLIGATDAFVRVRSYLARSKFAGALVAWAIICRHRAARRVFAGTFRLYGTHRNCATWACRTV